MAPKKAVATTSRYQGKSKAKRKTLEVGSVNQASTSSPLTPTQSATTTREGGPNQSDTVGKPSDHRYPKLSKAARNYLAGRCTSADSERVFSAGRRLVTEFRHNLSAMTIKKCMLLKSWVTVLGLDGELLLKKLCS